MTLFHLAEMLVGLTVITIIFYLYTMCKLRKLELMGQVLYDIKYTLGEFNYKRSNKISLSDYLDYMFMYIEIIPDIHKRTIDKNTGKVKESIPEPEFKPGEIVSVPIIPSTKGNKSRENVFYGFSLNGVHYVYTDVHSRGVILVTCYKDVQKIESESPVLDMTDSLTTTSNLKK